MRTVVGVTGDRQKAYKAAAHLRDTGFQNDISILWRHIEHENSETQSFQVGYDDNLWDGGATGASLGALGGLLVGAGLVTVPILGPLAAVGPAAGFLTGATAGGLAGAVADWGISPEGGRDIEEALQAGKTVLIIQCPDEQVGSTIALLRQHDIPQVTVH
ncbi:MAG: hypothetical protein GXX09_04535 [Syntrophomonadaceae bacterium]|nr:hypothetical protein [Syntrophomonadaceae bacterium]